MIVPPPPPLLLLLLLLLLATATVRGAVYLRGAKQTTLGIRIADSGAYEFVSPNDGSQLVRSAPTAVRTNSSAWCVAGTACAQGQLDNVVHRGVDAMLGPYRQVNATFGAAFTLTWRLYEELPAALLTLTLRSPLRRVPQHGMAAAAPELQSSVDCSSPSAGDQCDLDGAFPSLELQPRGTDMQFLSFGGTFAAPLLGQFTNDTALTMGGGNAVPFTLYSVRRQCALTFGPANHAMVSWALRSPSLDAATRTPAFSFGLSGMIGALAAGTSTSTLVYAATTPTHALRGWGSAYRTLIAAPPKKADTSLLSYWTDNGAYYYYTTEPGKTYAQTMLDVGDYLRNTSLPFRTFQFDSWWYPKGDGGGVTTWTPMKQLFPHGMQGVIEKMGFSKSAMTLHNRYFDPSTPYCQHYRCAVESKMALPLDRELFAAIMGEAKTKWGMYVYEQDWLVSTYNGMNATRNSLTNAAAWLSAMDAAALALGVNVQYCMPLPVHLLYSASLASVTQARVTGDYIPGTKPQWAYGYTSLLLDALGLKVFKDNFWSSSLPQPGCHYEAKHGCLEHNSELHAVVSAFSGGPVAVSDKIGLLNATRVMRMVSASGLVLAPSRPLAVSDVALRMVLPTRVPWHQAKNVAQVYDAVSVLSGDGDAWQRTYAYVFGAGLPGSVEYGVHDAAAAVPALLRKPLRAVRLHSHRHGMTSAAAADVRVFDASAPLVLDARGWNELAMPFELWMLVPAFGRFVFVGELGAKYVPVSPARLTHVHVSHFTSFDIGVNAAANERVELYFYDTVAGRSVAAGCAPTTRMRCNAEHELTCKCE